MATLDKRSNGRWRVRIRNRRAPALSKTFTRKADAMKWARDTKILIEQGHFTQTDNKLITLKDILESALQFALLDKKDPTETVL